jgi:hypothetical protein
MKRLLLLMFLCCSASHIFANKQGSKLALQYANECIKDFSADVKLVECYFQETPYSEHFTFQLYFKGLPVFMSQVKVNLTLQQNLLSLSNELCSITALENITQAVPSVFATEPYNYLCWYVKDGHAILGEYFRSAKIGCDFETITEYGNAAVLRHKNMARNFTGDTTIKAKVFLPDPLTTAAKVYGGTNADNSDATAAWLDNARVEVTIPATYDSATNLFILKNKYAQIVEKAFPAVAPITQNTNTFYFDRSASGFEDCNALFHISRFHKYFDSLGYNTILPMVTDIDAHGNLGDDNSTFYSTGGVPFLDMGEGGVDDAEDADVLVHEYSHGISWSANGGNSNTDERDGLDEGQADYFATSYSKQIDTFGWTRVFSWDGHNEFWAGRTATTTMNITTARTLSIYDVGEVWNTCMMKIWDQIGAAKTDKLMLQSLFSWSANMTTEQAAAYVLQADSLQNGGVNKYIICDVFRSRGIEPTWGCVLASLGNSSLQEVVVANTMQFANGMGNLSIDNLQKDSHVLMINAVGQSIYYKKGMQHLDISPEVISTSGVYTLIIANKNGTKQTFKIVRF